LADRLEIPVHYDFASSLCYVAHRVMTRMAEEIEQLGLRLVWRPLDLTLITGWRRGDPMHEAGLQNVLRVSSELDVPIRVPERWLDSRAAGALALALADGGQEQVLRERVWARVYEQGLPLDDDWLAGQAAELGADAGLAAGPRGRARLEAATHEAAAADVAGVPTFVLGEFPLGGIQEDYTMRSLFTRYARRRRGVH
jgi:predicted DsbA family dithiol-disulfide isomerase